MFSKKNSDGFFGQNRKFKPFFRLKTGDFRKKKGLYRNSDEFFGQNRKFKRFYHLKHVISKKKVFTKIQTAFSAEIRNSNGSSARITATPSQLTHQIRSGGCFHFLSKNRPQKHLKRAILHTFQANGGGLEPPPAPLGYVTECDTRWYNFPISVFPKMKNYIFAKDIRL